MCDSVALTFFNESLCRFEAHMCTLSLMKKKFPHWKHHFSSNFIWKWSKSVYILGKNGFSWNLYSDGIYSWWDTNFTSKFIQILTKISRSHSKFGSFIRLTIVTVKSSWNNNISKQIIYFCLQIPIPLVRNYFVNSKFWMRNSIPNWLCLW